MVRGIVNAVGCLSPCQNFFLLANAPTKRPNLGPADPIFAFGPIAPSPRISFNRRFPPFLLALPADPAPSSFCQTPGFEMKNWSDKLLRLLLTDRKFRHLDTPLYVVAQRTSSQKRPNKLKMNDHKRTISRVRLFFRRKNSKCQAPVVLSFVVAVSVKSNREGIEIEVSTIAIQLPADCLWKRRLWEISFRHERFLPSASKIFPSMVIPDRTGRTDVRQVRQYT